MWLTTHLQILLKLIRLSVLLPFLQVSLTPCLLHLDLEPGPADLLLPLGLMLSLFDGPLMVQH